MPPALTDPMIKAPELTTIGINYFGVLAQDNEVYTPSMLGQDIDEIIDLEADIISDEEDRSSEIGNKTNTLHTKMDKVSEKLDLSFDDISNIINYDKQVVLKLDTIKDHHD